MSQIEKGKPEAEDGEMPSLHPVQSQMEAPQSILHEAIFVAVISCAQLFTQIGLGVSIAPLHIIGDGLGTSNPGQLSWFAAGYSLTVGTFILPAGRLGDTFGHKKFFIGGFAWYALWSLLAGFSLYSGQILFDFCRAMQGIGPAMIMPNALAILARTYKPGKRQDMVFSIFGATAPGGFLLGAVFSSLLAQLAWWPWAYWILCIACALLALAGFFVIPKAPSPENTSGDSILVRVDALGACIGVTALVLFNFAWNQGPVVGWPTPYVYIILIIGALAFVVFLLVESKAKYPLLPVSQLSSDSVFVLGCVGAGWSSFGIWLFYTWSLMEEVRGSTPLSASAQFVPVALSGFAAALTTGYLLSKLPASVVMLIAMLCFTVGTILVATMPPFQIYWAQLFVAMLITPWGMDTSFPASSILMSRAMPREHQGLAASLVNTVINYSISIGLGFAGTVESRIRAQGADELTGYRSALYMGIGLGSLGIMVGLAFCFATWHRHRKSQGN